MHNRTDNNRTTRYTPRTTTGQTMGMQPDKQNTVTVRDKHCTTQEHTRPLGHARQQDTSIWGRGGGLKGQQQQNEFCVVNGVSRPLAVNSIISKLHTQTNNKMNVINKSCC